jgi:hypothetical protein
VDIVHRRQRSVRGRCFRRFLVTVERLAESEAQADRQGTEIEASRLAEKGFGIPLDHDAEGVAQFTDTFFLCAEAGARPQARVSTRRSWRA